MNEIELKDAHFFCSFCILSAFCVVFFVQGVVTVAVLIILSLKSAKMNSYYKKDSLLYLSEFLFFPEQYVQICVQYINVHVAFV